jgi:hypothetical protein
MLAQAFSVLALATNLSLTVAHDLGARETHMRSLLRALKVRVSSSLGRFPQAHNLTCKRPNDDVLYCQLK